MKPHSRSLNLVMFKLFLRKFLIILITQLSLRSVELISILTFPLEFLLDSLGIICHYCPPFNSTENLGIFKDTKCWLLFCFDASMAREILILLITWRLWKICECGPIHEITVVSILLFSKSPIIQSASGFICCMSYTSPQCPLKYNVTIWDTLTVLNKSPFP